MNHDEQDELIFPITLSQLNDAIARVSNSFQESGGPFGILTMIMAIHDVSAAGMGMVEGEPEHWNDLGRSLPIYAACVRIAERLQRIEPALCSLFGLRAGIGQTMAHITSKGTPQPHTTIEMLRDMMASTDRVICDILRDMRDSGRLAEYHDVAKEYREGAEKNGAAPLISMADILETLIRAMDDENSSEEPPDASSIDAWRIHEKS